ncbi:MAG: MipA/OmpV family protein [Sphingopyxis sp.]|nr:MipA/OmpV family protein [Sphingopyxis sp.]
MSHEIAALERQVIALSLDDPLSSLMKKNRLICWIFGDSATSLPLANARLEALRRYAILSRVFGVVPTGRERERLDRLGFDRRQMEMIDALLAPHRHRNRFRARVGNMLRRRAGHRTPGSPPPSPGPASGPSITPTLPNIEKDNMLQFPTPRARQAFLFAMLPLAMAPVEVQAQTDPMTLAMQGPPDEGDSPRGSDARRGADRGGGHGGPGVPGGPSGHGNGNQFIIGVGGMYAPKYRGDDDFAFQPLPYLDLKQGRFFANYRDGIGANFYESEAVTVGAGFMMADGYKSKDVPIGIGKLSTGLGGRGFVRVRQKGFQATVGVMKVISGSTEGVLADASLAYPIMASEKLMLMPSIGTTWANRKHNNRYFGVTATQSAASGLRQYSAGSGLVDAKAELLAIYRITDRIGVVAMGGVSTLMGDPKNSPIVYKKTSPQGIFGITYSF